MRLAEVTREVTNQLSDVAERYRVPERVGAASQKVYEGMTVAGKTASRGAQAAYRLALEHPKSSIGALLATAAIVGGVLWWMFGSHRQPLQRRSKPQRVRPHTERRRGRAKSAAAHAR